MPLRERGFFVPDHELSARAYLAGDHSPFIIAGHTGTLLELYNHRVISGSQEYYLQQDTLPYLRTAEQGLAVTVGRAMLQPEQTLTFFHGTTIDMEDWERQSMEAFGYTLVVFGALPEYARSEMFPQGFSRHGILRAPTTPLEFLLRIKEMQREIEIVSHGQKTHELPYARTYKFFQVARELPLEMPEGAKEQEERARHEFNKLLDNIRVDL